MRAWKTFAFLVIGATLVALPSAPAQQEKSEKKQDDKKGPPDDRKGPPKGGFGGPMGEVRKVLAKYDTDKNGRLDATERKAARKALESDRGGFGKGGFGKGGMGKGTPK